MACKYILFSMLKTGVIKLVLLVFCLFSLSAHAQDYPLPLVMVVHQDSSIKKLKKSDIIDIYMGRFQTFPDGSPAQPLDFPTDSVERSYFYELLVGKSEKKINAYWSRLLFSGRAKPPLKADSKSDVISSFGVNTIAYLNLNDITKEMKIVYEL